jgi:hypothetical protein
MGKIWRLLRGKIASAEQGYCRHKLTHSGSLYCTTKAYNFLSSITNALLDGMARDVFVSCQPFCKVQQLLSFTQKYGREAFVCTSLPEEKHANQDVPLPPLQDHSMKMVG